MLVFCLKKRNEKPNICVHVSKCVHPKKETSRHPPHHSHTHHKSREMSDDNTDTQRFSPAEMEQSDGTVRNWDFTVTRTRIYLPYVIGCVVAVYSLVVGILLGKVSTGIQSLVDADKRFERTIDGNYEFKIVGWCPCGRTLPARTLYDSDADTELPVVDETCYGCFDKWSSGVDNTWPKTDYDPAVGASVLSGGCRENW